MKKSPSLVHFTLGAGLFLALGLAVSGAVPDTAKKPLPDEAKGAIDLGIAAEQKQYHLLAIHFFEEARRLAPADAGIYYQLGQAEANIPGRELRAMAWFGAYLAANPNAPEAAAIKDQIKTLNVQSLHNLWQLTQKAQDERELAQSSARAAGPSSFAFKQSPLTLKLNTDLAGVPSPFAQIVTLWVATEGVTTVQSAVEHLTDANTKMVAENAVAVAQARAGDLVGVQKTIAQIPDQNVKMTTKLALAAAQAAAGDIAGALSTDNKVPEAMTQLGSSMFRPKLDTVYAIIKAQLKMKDFQGARTTAMRMPQTSNHEARADVMIASAQIDAGDVNGAPETLRYARNLASRFDLWHLGILSDLIVEQQLRNGELVEAQSTVRNMLGINIREHDKPNGTVNDWYRDAGAQGVAWGQVLVGDFAGAQNTVDTLAVTQAVKNELEQMITVNQAKAGDIAGAQKTASRIVPGMKTGNMGAKVDAEIAIAEAQTKAGDNIGSQASFQLAQEAIEALSSEGAKRLGELDIARAQEATGDFEGAQITTELIPEASVENTLTSSRLILLVSASGWVGELDGHLNTNLYLDFAAEMKTRSVGDPAKDFNSLITAVNQALTEQNHLIQMLQKQGVLPKPETTLLPVN